MKPLGKDSDSLSKQDISKLIDQVLKESFISQSQRSTGCSKDKIIIYCTEQDIRLIINNSFYKKEVTREQLLELSLLFLNKAMNR